MLFIMLKTIHLPCNVSCLDSALLKSWGPKHTKKQLFLPQQENQVSLLKVNTGLTLKRQLYFSRSTLTLTASLLFISLLPLEIKIRSCNIKTKNPIMEHFQQVQGSVDRPKGKSVDTWITKCWPNPLMTMLLNIADYI